MAAQTDAQLVLGRRFEGRRVLRQHGAVTTRLGLDEQTGQQVVIKSIQRGLLPVAVKERIARDAGMLRGLDALTPPPLIAWGEDHGWFYLVSPFLEGSDLSRRTGREPLKPLEVTRVGQQLLGQLALAHEAGVLHRNIKPSNVVCNPADGAAHLVDYSLSPVDLLDPATRDLKVEALRYLAPEQVGLLRGPVDSRSDLYSVGLLLYECLAGQPLHDGEHVGELLRQQVTVAPPSLRWMGIQLPRALEDLVMRLLQKDPADRYQTAAAAARDLRAIERGLAGHQRDPTVVIGQDDWRSALTEPTFVGRREELQRLEQALVRARLGEGGVVVLEGEAGAGKTTVLDELGRRAAASGAWVARGEAEEQPGRLPFQLLEPVVQLLRDEETLFARVRAEVGALLPELARALPSLVDVAGEPGDESTSEARLHESCTQRALARLIAALGTPERSAVLLLDDCQSADEALLRGLGLLEADGGLHTLVVLSLRPDALTADHPVLTLEPLMRVTLGPLDDEEVQQLLESMAGRLPAEVSELVARLCGGNPAMAAAILWGMVESDALRPGDGGWELVQHELAQLQSSRRVGTMLARRIEQAPARVTRVLRCGALLGKSFELDHVAAVSGLAEDRVRALLLEARRRHLLWTDARGTRWHFAHRLLQEQLLSGLEDAEALHLRAARYLQRSRRSRGTPFQIAYHLDAAGRPGEALPYALEAAERARRQHALDVAELQYRVAARGAEAGDRATRSRVAAGLGEVLLARNQHDEAREQLQLALALCQDDRTRARIHGQLGRLAYRRGENRLASTTLEQGLHLLGHPVPADRKQMLGQLAGELVRWLGGRPPRFTADERSTLERLALGLHTHLPVVWWHDRGLLAAVWSHLYRLNRARRYPGSAELGYAYAFHARLLASVSLFEQAEHYIELSQEIGQRLDDPWGQGHISFMHGMVYYAGARFEEAEAKLVPAISQLAEAGDPWQVLSAKGILGCVYLRQGELSRAEAMGREVHEQGVERDQALPSSAGLDIWAKASGGKLPASLTRAELVRAGDDVLRRSLVTQAEAVRLLREGDARGAADVLERAWGETGRAHIRREHVFPIPGWLLTARRLCASQLPEESRERERLLRRARRLGGRARLLARRFPNHRPHVLRECGLLEAMCRQFDPALCYLDRSVAAAQEQGARYELANSLLARARVGRSLGLASARADATSGMHLLREVGSDFALGEVLPRDVVPVDEPPGAATVSLVVRFDQLLEVGRRIVTSLSREAAFDAAREAAANLIRGENCVVVEHAEHGGVRVVAGDPDLHVSRTMVRRALDGGVPQVAASGVPQGSSVLSDSIMLTGVRSVLVAPIPMRGERRYCLYINHARVGGLFGEEEQRLAAFIASLVGAALENAHSYSELELAFDALHRAHADLKSTQAQLVQAAKLAALGQLGAGIAHELNQPIQSIQGFAQRIRRHTDARVADHDDELGIIVRATDRMAQIVNNIRKFAREGQVAREPIDPLLPFRDALALLDQQLQQQGIAIQWELQDEQLPRVMGDPMQLQQVFLNLLLNARDALATLPDQTPRRLRLGAELEGDRVVLTVADSGPGVPPELASRIFDPFFTTKDAGHGTGLGLSISYGIVQDHGGELVHEAGEQGGARFAVVLPVAGES